MGLYTDVLIEKEKRDLSLADSAEEALLENRLNRSSLDDTKHVRNAVSWILGLFGITAQEIRSCKTTEDVLNAMLDPVNILYEKTDMQTNAWRRQSNPVLAFSQDKSPLVLTPSLTGFQFYQPETKEKGIISGNTKLLNEGYIVFRPLEGDNFSIKSFFKLMLHMISLRDILLIIACGLAVSLMGLVAPNVTKQVLSEVIEIGQGAVPYLLTSCVVFLTAGLAKGFFSILRTLVLGNMKQRISSQMQTAIMGKLLLMPYEFFENGSPGKLSNQIRNGKKLSDMLVDFVLNSMLSTAFSLVYIPQMYYLAPVLVIPALIVLVIQMTLSVVLTMLSADYTAMKTGLQQENESFLFDILKGIQKIQSIGASKRVYARAAENYRALLSADLYPPKYILLKEVILDFISAAGAAVVLIIAAYAKVSQADYVAFTASYGLLAGSVTTLVQMCNNIVSIQPPLEQLRSLFSYEGREEGVEFVTELKGNIDIEDLRFSYRKGERGCIDNISLNIRAGEKIALVGESGCGKSTLLKLMLGMITPDSGTILFDGKPLPTLNKRSLRRRVASVFQFTRAFPGSVFDNIAFTSRDLTLDEAWEAAGMAAIDDDIRSLPFGMETEITEGNGGGFSGGQKQRLMIARAFAQKPSLLILDEATSALDNISQHKVLESVYGMKCTVIMAAHRLSTVIDCDRILVFQNGHIVEEGTYSELTNMNGYFLELVKKQQVAQE